MLLSDEQLIYSIFDDADVLYLQTNIIIFVITVNCKKLGHYNLKTKMLKQY